MTEPKTVDKKQTKQPCWWEVRASLSTVDKKKAYDAYCREHAARLKELYAIAGHCPGDGRGY